MKFNANEHAEGLVRANGYDIAVSIADRSMRATSGEAEATLPKGTVFTPDMKKRGSRNAVKERVKLHNFWVQVSNILHKEGK